MTPGTCKHFTCLADGKCKAGVHYMTLANDETDEHGNPISEFMTGYQKRLPCIASEGGQHVVKCAKREEATDAEIAAANAAVKARVEFEKKIVGEGGVVDQVRAYLLSHVFRDANGSMVIDPMRQECVMPCPLCQKELIVRQGGRILKCTTPDCVSWQADLDTSPLRDVARSTGATTFEAAEARRAR
jgi:hypothetical protein